MGAGQSSSNTSKSPALEDQLDEANAARALLQSKVLQLENELESAKRREKTNVVEELNSRRKFVAFIQESVMPFGTAELQKHLDQLNAKIESIDEGTDLNDFDVKVPDPDYDKLKLEALSNVDEREKSIDIIKKIRTMFPDRSDEDIFKDIKAVKEKNGNTLKNLSADHIVDQIIENTENSNDEGMHDFEISTFANKVPKLKKKIILQNQNVVFATIHCRLRPIANWIVDIYFIDHVLEIGSNNRKIAPYAEEVLLCLQEANTEVVVVEDDVGLIIDWVITFLFIIIECPTK